MKAFSDSNEFYQAYEKLKECFNKMQPELELTLRDNEAGVEGYVVVWNTSICKNGPFDNNGKGAGKGGTRISPNLEIKDIKRLARAMAEKNAAAALPLGGAKSGLKYDPDAPDCEEKYRRFVKMAQNAGILLEHGGIFGGFGYDVGGKPPLNAIWACDELGTLNAFTGKPVDMGGTDYDKEGVAGLGVAVAAKTMVEIHGRDVSDVTYSIQGIGAMGAAVARYFSGYGAILKSFSDPKYGGLWVFDNGADDALIHAIAKGDASSVENLINAQGRKVSEDCSEALYTEVDVIFPCALEDAITAQNAERIVAPFICEGANNPTNEEAHQILFDRGVKVVPDIIANPGGVIAAFVELSSKVSVEENIKTRAKVEEAKNFTREKVEANTRLLFEYVNNLEVRADKVADYMAWDHIIHGLD